MFAGRLLLPEWARLWPDLLWPAHALLRRAMLRRHLQWQHLLRCGDIAVRQRLLRWHVLQWLLLSVWPAVLQWHVLPIRVCLPEQPVCSGVQCGGGALRHNLLYWRPELLHMPEWRTRLPLWPVYQLRVRARGHRFSGSE